MTRTSFAQIRRQLAYKEATDVMDTISREKAELAEFLEIETQMDFDEAMGVIERLCTEILPGYRGIGKLIVFRNEIRDQLKSALRSDEND